MDGLFDFSGGLIDLLLTFTMMNKYPTSTVILGLLLTLTSVNLHATSAIMATYNAPSCSSCHGNNIETKANGTVGLSNYLTALNNTQAQLVRFITNLGPIDLSLYTATAPITVQNFLKYVSGNHYNQSIFHRSIPGFIIQGGGYTSELTNSNVKGIGNFGAISNEYSITRSNTRGTIAMAKTPDNPNSATNQWFINLANNASNLDNQNGGFTVFGAVINSGMTVADKIAALPTVNASSPTISLPNLPIATAISNNQLTGANLVRISSATVSPDKTTLNNADRIFNYLEAAYPDYVSPANPLTPAASGSNTVAPYYYRYYANSQSYIATANDKVLYLGPLVGNQITDLGTVASWLTVATEAGY